MNPKSDKDITRLSTVSAIAYRRSEWQRKNREDLLRSYVGKEYGETTPEAARTVIYLMKQTAEAHQTGLAYQRPRFLLTAERQELKSFADTFQLAINNLVREIHLEEVFSQMVMDAFFGLSVCCIMPGDSPEVMLELDEWSEPGLPYVQRVAPDHYIWDIGARDLRSCQYQAYRYRVPLKYLRDLIPDGWNKKACKEVKATSKYDRGEPRAEDLGFDDRDDDELEQMADLAYYWLPYEKKVATYAVDSRFNIAVDKPIGVFDWTGDEAGPFAHLNLGPVPDNVLAIPPGQTLRHLDRLMQANLNKLESQANRQRIINTYDGRNAGDANRLRSAMDGDWIKLNFHDGIGQHKVDSLDQGLFGFNLQIQNTYDRMAGNLTARSGLGASAPTAAQEQMIMGQVAESEGFMMGKMHQFAVDVAKRMGLLLWKDGNKGSTLNATRDLVPGYEVDATWYPNDPDIPDAREGEFPDYEFKIEPDSMGYKSPQQRAQTLIGIAEKVASWQLPDVQVDAPALVEELAVLLDAPRLRHVIKYRPPMDSATGQAEGKQAPHTVREEVRRGSPGMSQQGKNQQMAMQMVGQSNDNESY